jgi:hypothetical protein
MSVRSRLVAASFKQHRRLMLAALAGLLFFVISASMHVLLTWTGLQTSVTQPPSMHLHEVRIDTLPAVLASAGVTEAAIVKVVPSANGSLLQVTTSAEQPRRYFNLATGQELPGQDEAQARWLVQHYLPGNTRAITDIRLQTAFSGEYPWVNRLLPVYRISLEGDDGLTLFIHTETLAMTGITDHSKNIAQWVFRQLHTWQWLDGLPFARILLMTLLLLAILGMLVAGLGLLLALRRTGPLAAGRRTHRIMAHLLWLPLLGFTVSGLYHLLHQQYAPQQREFSLAQPNALPATGAVSLEGLDQPLNALALLQVGDRWLYRGSLAQTAMPAMGGEHDHHAVRQQRYDGIPREAGGLYWDASSGARLTDVDDRHVARVFATHLTGIDDRMITGVSVVTRFGPGYDFRNKRLPVWQVDTVTAAGDRLFVDLSSGVLVDRNTASSRLEGLSFSFLHKWNFLVWPLGRENRDLLIMAILAGTLILAGLGWRLRRRT